ncbi:MAG: sulfatase-like hydrolase/transferase [Armatimonadetes bacterium]|nr:sulfatase-like hydrolase/transferase [Armatimonadota bacterium]
MNFIVIVSDTLRRGFLGCYGGTEADTRHIDAFASRSLVFDRAYSASFPTVPHRRDVMTGRYTFTYTPWAPLTQQEPVLSNMLRKAGYTSMMIADNPHILENGYHFDRGFDAFEWVRGQESDRWKLSPKSLSYPCDPSKLRQPHSLTASHHRLSTQWRYEEDRFVARTMSTACCWLEDNRELDRFFLYVDAFDPHEPWDPPQWLVDKFDPNYHGDVVDYPRYEYVDEFLTPEELKHCRALYTAEVTLVDRWVGRLLEKIEDLGLLENTLVLLTSDHGFLHGEHGIIGKSLIQPSGFRYIPLYEEINHIPWIIHYPNVKFRRTSAIVQPPDILPTLLDFADLKPTDPVDGVSFRPVIEGEDTARSYAVASPYALEGGAASAQATVTFDRWSAVLSGRLPGQVRESDAAVDGSEKRLGGTAHSNDLLFDLTADPGQQQNLAEQHPDVLDHARRLFTETLSAAKMREDAIELWK